MSFGSVNNVSLSYSAFVESFNQMVLEDHKPAFVEFVADCTNGRDLPSVDLNEKADLFLYSVQDDTEVCVKIASQIAIHVERYNTKDPSEMIAMAFQLCLFLSASDEDVIEAFTKLQPLLQKTECAPDALHELVRLLLEVKIPFSVLTSLLQITAHVHSEGVFCGWNALQMGKYTLFFRDSLRPAMSRLGGLCCESMRPLYEMILPTVTVTKTGQVYPRELYAPLLKMLKSPSSVVSSVGFSVLSTFSLENEPAAAAFRVYLPRLLACGLFNAHIIRPAFGMLASNISKGEFGIATHLLHILFSRYSVDEIVARTPTTNANLYALLVSIAPTHPDTLHYLADKKLNSEQEQQLVGHWCGLIERDAFYDECMKDTHFGIHLLKKGAPAGVIKAVVSLKSRTLDSCYYLITHKKFAALFADDPEYLFWVYLSYAEVRSNSLVRVPELVKMAYAVAFQADRGAVYLRLSQHVAALPALDIDRWPLIEKLIQFEMHREAIELFESAATALGPHAEEVLLWCEGLLIRQRFEDLERVFTACRPDVYPERCARIVFELARRSCSEERLEQIAACNLTGDPELFFEILEFAASIAPNRLLQHLLGKLSHFRQHLSANRDMFMKAAVVTCAQFQDSEVCDQLLESILFCMPGMSRGELEIATRLIHILISRHSVDEIVARMPAIKADLYAFLVSIAPTHPDTLHYLADKKLNSEQEQQLVDHWSGLIERDAFYDECMKDSHFGIHLLKKGAPAEVIKAVVSLKSRTLDSCYYLITHKKFAALFADDPEYLVGVYLSYVEVRSDSLERGLELAKMASKVAFQADVGAVYLRLSQNVAALPALDIDRWPLIEKLIQFEMHREAIELFESAATTLGSHAEEVLLWCEGLLIRQRFDDLERVFTACRPDVYPERCARIVFELAKRSCSEERLEQIAACNLTGDPELFFEVLEFAASIAPNRLLQHLLGKLSHFRQHLSANRDMFMKAAVVTCAQFQDSRACDQLLESVLLCMPDDTPEAVAQVLAIVEAVGSRVSLIRSAALLIQHPSSALKAKACMNLLEGIKTTTQQSDVPQIEYSQFFAFPECESWREQILQALEESAPFGAIYYKLLMASLQKSSAVAVFTRVKKHLRKALMRKKQVEAQSVAYAKECLELFFAWTPAFGDPLLLEQCKELQWVKTLISQRQSVLEEYIAPRLYEKVTCAMLGCGLDPTGLPSVNPLSNFFIACDRERIFEGNFDLYCQLYLFTFGVLPKGDDLSMSEQRLLTTDSSSIVFKLLQRLAVNPALLKRFADILHDHYALLDKNQIIKCCNLVKSTVKPMRTRWTVQKEILAIIDTIPDDLARASLHKQLEQKL